VLGPLLPLIDRRLCRTHRRLMHAIERPIEKWGVLDNHVRSFMASRNRCLQPGLRVETAKVAVEYLAVDWRGEAVRAGKVRGKIPSSTEFQELTR
jgi:hypothetical protein